MSCTNFEHSNTPNCLKSRYLGFILICAVVADIFLQYWTVFCPFEAFPACGVEWFNTTDFFYMLGCDGAKHPNKGLILLWFRILHFLWPFSVIDLVAALVNL